MAPDRSPLELARDFLPSLVPAGLFLSGEDGLRVTTFNAAAAVTLAIEGRQFVPGRGVQAFAERHVPNTDRTTASTLIQLGEGWLLDVHIRASGGTPRRGQCFAVLEVVRGRNNSSVVPLAVLAQGYVTDTQRRGWPASPLEMSPEGPGVLRSIAGTDPAAGVEISEAVPTNARWRVLAIHFTFVTDATVATREVDLLFSSGGATLAVAIPATTQAASLTLTYNWSRQAQRVQGSTSLINSGSIPEADLPAAATVASFTTNVQAGDNFGAPQLLVEEWIED